VGLPHQHRFGRRDGGRDRQWLSGGVLYFSAPDHVWAVDARTGRERWHYFWKTLGGDHIGNRGVGMYKNWIYFVTPDDFLVCLDAATGAERWTKQVASVKQEYFATDAPVVVGNHLLLGISGDALNLQGQLQSRDPETGELQWVFHTTPKAGEPGIETWPNADASAHGGGPPWLPGTYDPKLNLYYFGTGNPNPSLAGQGRPGDNLWTSSIVAINPDTGKMAWFYQVSPHDTHDYDAAQTPVLIDGVIDGKPRKLIAQASRTGYYFLLDRTNGRHIATQRLGDTVNWTLGINAKGQPIRNPAKDASIPGALVSPSNPGVTNWPAPSFDPETGLFYVGTSQSYSIFYLSDTSPNPQGYGAIERNLGSIGNVLKALDYRNGKVKWSRTMSLPDPLVSGAVGLLSTSGGLLFGGDTGGNFVGYDAATGTPLWHASLTATPGNGPINYMLDSRQYVVTGAGDSLYAFYLQ
jgi:acido-empty-quinoprotein group A